MKEIIQIEVKKGLFFYSRYRQLHAMTISIVWKTLLFVASILDNQNILGLWLNIRPFPSMLVMFLLGIEVPNMSLKDVGKCLLMIKYNSALTFLWIQDLLYDVLTIYSYWYIFCILGVLFNASIKSSSKLRFLSKTFIWNKNAFLVTI